MKEMNFKGVQVDYIDISENSELGFNFPFKILIPKNLNDNPDLIYACNLTQDFSSECDSMEGLINKTKDDLDFGSIDPMLTHLCIENGNPMVIPFIPRLKTFRPNFLGRDCLYNKFNLGEEDKKYQDYMFMYNNLADQHKAIIDKAKEVLKDEGINVDSRAIISGYSEGAKFASHLALLHPELFKAVVAGGTGGAISMPISEINGKELKYPLGISDIKFNEEEFRKIKFFYYIGKSDLADSAMPKFSLIHYIDKNGNDNIVRDECGNITPYINDYDDNSKIIYVTYYLEDGKREIKNIIINNTDLNKYIFYKNNKGENTPLFDEKGNQLKNMLVLNDNGDYLSGFSLFSDEDVNILNKELGIRTQDRFKEQKKIYNECELDCKFKEYDGNHRTIFDKREIIFSDVDNFINNLDRRNTHTR